MQYDIKNNLGRTTHVATNLRSYFNNLIDHNCRDSDGNQSHGRYCHNHTSACDHPFCRGSCWANSEATCRFRTQSALFDTGIKSFCECTRPSASQLISVIHKKSQNAQLCNNRSQLATSAYQISLRKQCTQNQIPQQIEDFWRKPAYGKAPWEKPDNSVHVIMEIFLVWVFYKRHED